VESFISLSAELTKFCCF